MSLPRGPVRSCQRERLGDTVLLRAVRPQCPVLGVSLQEGRGRGLCTS